MVVLRASLLNFNLHLRRSSPLSHSSIPWWLGGTSSCGQTGLFSTVEIVEELPNNVLSAKIVNNCARKLNKTSKSQSYFMFVAASFEHKNLLFSCCAFKILNLMLVHRRIDLPNRLKSSCVDEQPASQIFDHNLHILGNILLNAKWRTLPPPSFPRLHSSVCSFFLLKNFARTHCLKNDRVSPAFHLSAAVSSAAFSCF